ncbi:MAG: peptidyl-prolyl cis-trans isomerase [Bacteroidota bacterium]|nr:peptidyl-prolyl cis-trans isomerase [Bacteroidota bacterium]
MATPCLAQVVKLPKENSFTDSNNSITVARVGPLSISAEEFLLSYDFGPAFPKREKNSKKRYLNYMINEKLLALDGYSGNVQKSRAVKQALAELKGDFATEELYKDDVLGKVKVTNEDIAAGMKEDRLHLSVRWIFSPTKEEILRQRTLIASGVSFDSLFRDQLNDRVTTADRSMETTLFKLEMKNSVFAQAVASLSVNSVSQPLHGPDGWYLVKISDVWMNPIVTKGDEMKMSEDVKGALVQHRADSLSDLYVRTVMMSESPVIVRTTFGLVLAHLGKILLPEKVFSQSNFMDHVIAQRGPVDVAKIDRFGHEALVQLKHGSLSLNSFLEWYDAREANLKPDILSPQKFFSWLESMVWRMVRDRLLTARALKRGLQERPVVQQQLQWWEEKLVYNLVKNGISDSIQTNDSVLYTYYEKNPRSFRDGKGKEISFHDAKDDVLRQYYSAEMTARMLHRILKLKQEYKITINDKALDSLPVDTQNDPRAIDMYAVKKGGTFPHPAFPSIDYDWASWE